VCVCVCACVWVSEREREREREREGERECVWDLCWCYEVALILFSFLKERIHILLEPSQDTVYLRLDHCCYRSSVIRVETDMETWLFRFIYRTTSRKKGTFMDSTAPIHLVWNLIEDSPKGANTLPTFHSSCTLRTSRFCLEAKGVTFQPRLYVRVCLIRFDRHPVGWHWHCKITSPWWLSDSCAQITPDGWRPRLRPWP